MSLSRGLGQVVYLLCASVSSLGSGYDSPGPIKLGEGKWLNPVGAGAGHTGGAGGCQLESSLVSRQDPFSPPGPFLQEPGNCPPTGREEKQQVRGQRFRP